MATQEFAGGSSSSDRANPNLNTLEVDEYNFEEDHGTIEDGYEDESANGTGDNKPLLEDTNKRIVKVGVVNMSGRNIFLIC
jgi:hypothetical protein